MKNKIKILRIFRALTQIVFFIFFAELFSLAFSSIKNVYLGMLNGELVIANMFASMTMLVMIIILTLVAGRFFCGWLCAFGALSDTVFTLSRKVFKVNFKISEKIDKPLKYLKYLVLFSIVFLGWTNNIDSMNRFNPWNAFAELRVFSPNIMKHPTQLVILLSIMFGVALVERFFCRYLCPLGAVQALLSKFKLSKLVREDSTCSGCNLCTENCSMGIKVSEVEKVSSGECIGCLKCSENCPNNSLKVGTLRKSVKPLVYAFLGLGLFTSMYSFRYIIKETIKKTEFQVQAKQGYEAINVEEDIVENNDGDVDKENQVANPKNEINKVEEVENKIYADGIYTGVSVGKKPEIRVKVCIDKDKITSIDIVSHKEDVEYCEIPFEMIPEKIISTQSLEVDGVSGATNTSNRLIKAVENAVEKAKK